MSDTVPCLAGSPASWRRSSPPIFAGRQDYSADDFWHRPSAHCRRYVNGARNLGQSRRAAPSRLAILIILQTHTPQISARSTAKKDEGNTKNGNKYLASA